VCPGLGDELLNAELFADVREARALAAAWKNEYNHRRPHSSLGYVPPAMFAARCVGATPLRLASLASAPCPRQTKEHPPTLTTIGT